MLERGIVMQRSVIYALIAIIAILVLLTVFVFNPQQGNQEKSQNFSEISNWAVYINNTKSSIIHASTQPDGKAKWSGVVKIVVYNQSGAPMKDVNVLLNGCGITEGNITDENGSVVFYLKNVTLPAGTSVGEIEVQLSYYKSDAPQIKQDSIVVIRKSD